MFFLDEVDFVQTQNLPIRDLWLFLPFGYLLTILIETPILILGLAQKITLRQRLLCGFWLTACTYPIVALVLPTLMLGFPRWQYLLVAETFAPVGECILFWAAFKNAGLASAGWVRSLAAIVLANLASFGFGEVMNYYQWFNLL